MQKLNFEGVKVSDVIHETIKSKNDTAKEWQKITVILYFAEFIETQSGGFEKEAYIPIVFFGNNASRAENVDAGDVVTIGAELGGRFWEKDGEKRYFPEVNGFSCYIKEKYNAGAKESQPKGTQNDFLDEVDELPF